MTEAHGELVYPKQAGELGKGDFMVCAEKYPCKIMDFSSSKTGKHGHAKASFTCVDIFTGKKYEDSCPTSHNIMCPKVNSFQGIVTGYDDDYVFYLDDANEPKEIPLPPWPEGLADKLKEGFDISTNDGTNIVISCCSAMGVTQIMSFRADK